MGHLLYTTAAAWSPSKITRNHCLENGIPWEDTVLVHGKGLFLLVSLKRDRPRPRPGAVSAGEGAFCYKIP
jgi:hypothetical protein